MSPLRFPTSMQEAAMLIGGYFIRFEVLLLAAVLVLWVVMGRLGRRLDARRSAARDAEIAPRAAARGWSYRGEHEYRHSVLHFAGNTAGVPWELECYEVHEHRGSWGQGTPRARWRTRSVALPGGVVALWPARHAPGPGDRPAVDGESLIAKLMLRPLIWALRAEPEDAELLLRSRPVDGLPPEVARHFYVTAGSRADADGFLTPAVRRALAEHMAWAESPQGEETPGAVPKVVVFWHHGLTILASGSSYAPEALDRLVGFGVALAGAVQGREAPAGVGPG